MQQICNIWWFLCLKKSQATSTSNMSMAREYLGLIPAAPLSGKNVQVRNGVGQMVDSLQVKNPTYTLQDPSGNNITGSTFIVYFFSFKNNPGELQWWSLRFGDPLDAKIIPWQDFWRDWRKKSCYVIFLFRSCKFIIKESKELHHQKCASLKMCTLLKIENNSFWVNYVAIA